MNKAEAKTTATENPPERIQGCGTIALLAFSSIWVIGLSALDLILCWSVEQTLFENPVGIYDFRWIIHSVYSFLLLVPMVLMYVLVKTPRLKLMFRLWMIAGCFAAVGIPMKMLAVTAQQETAMLQIGICAIFIFGLKAIQKGDKKEAAKELPRSHNFGLIALVGAAMSIPWVLYGSLGSWEDTVLFALSGILFGVMTVSLVYPLLLEITEHQDREIKVADFILDGFVVALFLLITITAMSQNGSQVVLVLTVPVTGWLITLISISGRGTQDKGKWGAAAITGLALLLPLVWFDMDELFMLISSAPGETLEYATKSAWYTCMICMVFVIVVLVNFQYLSRIKLNQKMNLLLGGLMVAAVVTTYFMFGRVGFFGERFFAVMDQTTDLSTIVQSAEIGEKRTEVYQALVAEAEKSQSALRADLDKRGLRYTPYYLVNGLEIQGGIYTRYWVNRYPGVDHTVESPVLRPLPKKTALSAGSVSEAPARPSWNLEMIGVDKVWNDLGITGKGIIVGQADSGADARHVELSDSYRGKNGGDDYNWLDPWNDSPFPEDTQGHGTQTLGLIVGKNIGVAPDAQWMGCVNLARNLGNPAHYLDCMQFMLAPYPQGGDSFTEGDPAQGAMIINNSWSCPRSEGCDTLIFENTALALEKAGIFVTSAAGNTGIYGCGSITDPMAIYLSVFTVGSVNQEGSISEFSSLGPVVVDGSDRVKPDLVAPGEGITSSYPGGTYQTSSGTSFSSPQVAGVVALMWSANPRLIGNVEVTRQILEETATKVEAAVPECAIVQSGPNNAYGFGLLNAFEAVQAALKYK